MTGWLSCVLLLTSCTATELWAIIDKSAAPIMLLVVVAVVTTVLVPIISPFAMIVATR